MTEAFGQTCFAIRVLAGRASHAQTGGGAIAAVASIYGRESGDDLQLRQGC